MAPALGRAPANRRPGFRRWRLVLLLALIVVPILEITTIIAVGRAIGGWPTFGLLLLESAIGAWLVRREGARSWRALRSALRSGAMPSRELADAALILVGGMLLITPGFLTDIAGFFFVLPFTRPIARRVLEAVVARRLLGAGWRGGPGRPGPGGQGGGAGAGRSGGPDGPDGPDGPPDVIRGEVL